MNSWAGICLAHQEQAGIHNPYEQERREQDAIRHGDVAALNRSISETYEGKIGQLAKDPLRHHKNVAIGNITLASRTAVEAGVSVEKSFTMADSMIQRLKKLTMLSKWKHSSGWHSGCTQMSWRKNCR